MKKFPPRRRLWPAAALLCLLALPLLLPRLSGDRSAPAAPAQTAEEADFFVHLTLSSTPPPCLNSPEVLTQVREILGSMVPLSPAPQELPAPASYLTAWRGEEQLGTFTIHAPSGEEDVRPVSFQGADGTRSCWQLPAAQVRALDGLRGAQLDYEEAQAEQIRAAIQAPQAWVCGQVRRSDPAFAREMERLFQRDFQDSSLWLSEWLAYQSQGTLDQWYDLERARALSLTGRDGAVFRFSLIPYHENAYQVLALAGEDGQVVRLLALLPNDTLEELDLLLASPDA